MANFQFSLSPLFWARFNQVNGLLSAGPLKSRPGEPHRHITIPMAPDRRGRFKPHLTTHRATGRKDLDWLLDVPFEEWLTVVRELQRDMVVAFQAALCPVELEELTDFGYIACLSPPSEVLAHALREHFALRGSKMNVKWSLDVIIDFLLCLLDFAVLPVQVQPSDVRLHPLPLFLIDEEGNIIESRLLMYFRHPIGIGEKPGWYTLVADALSLEVGFRAFVRVLGRDFFAAMEYAMGEFGQSTTPQWEELKQRLNV